MWFEIRIWDGQTFGKIKMMAGEIDLQYHVAGLIPPKDDGLKFELPNMEMMHRTCQTWEHTPPNCCKRLGILFVLSHPHIELALSGDPHAEKKYLGDCSAVI